MVTIAVVGAQRRQPGNPPIVEPVEFPSRQGRLLVGDLFRPAPGAGDWIVLLHGMESCRGGTKQLAMTEHAIAAGYGVLRFDFSFVGDSEGRFEDMTVSGEVADASGALDFLSEFGPRSTTLVGSSLGGLVSLLVAAADQRVGRLITIAAVADTALFSDELSEAELADWQSSGRRAWGEKHLKWGFLDDARSIDVAARIVEIDVPTLVLHGEDDPVVPPRHADVIESSVSGPVRKRMYAGVGHRFDEPGALDALLAEFDAWLEETGTAP